MDHVLTLLQLSVFLLPVCLLLRDHGCFAFAARVFEWLSQRTRVSLGCKAVASKTKQRWPFLVPGTVEVAQVAVPPCTQKREILDRSPDTLHFSPHVPTAQGHHVSIAVDDWEEEEEKQGKANEMNELDAERGSATPASAGYGSESDVSVIAQGADYSESGGDISLVDLRQSLTMFTLEVKDVASSSSFRPIETKRSLPVMLNVLVGMKTQRYLSSRMWALQAPAAHNKVDFCDGASTNQKHPCTQRIER